MRCIYFVQAFRSHFLKERVRRYDSRGLIHEEEESITYREFDAITDRIAYGLERLGVAPRDRVAVLHPNSAQTLLAFFAIIKAGGVVVPINPIYTSREVTYLLNNSESTMLIIHEDFSSLVDQIKGDAPRLNRIVLRRRTETVEAEIAALAGAHLVPGKEMPFNSDDPAIMFYTSGTTGSPKGVVLTHGNFCFCGPNIAQSYGLRENDISIAALHMVHVFSIANLFVEVNHEIGYYIFLCVVNVCVAQLWCCGSALGRARCKRRALQPQDGGVSFSPGKQFSL